MMKKQLLLGLFLTLVIYATTQASMIQNTMQFLKNLGTVSVSQKTANSLTSSFLTSASRRASIQRLDQPTNQISQGTATPTFTNPPEKKNLAPTRTPRPTTTPMPIPPSANPNATTLMIIFGLIAVIVVIVGVWLNRSEK
jgi:hypothetical protein